MYVRHLQVTDFRSWPHADVALTPGPNVLIGPNGHGKTNLVEALCYLATLGSHRVATDAPLVRRGRERALVRAAVVNAGRELTVDLEITPGRANRAKINRAPAAKPREILGILRAVLFAPEDLALVRGDPGERRRFLDDLLVARAPKYAGVRSDYDRVLRQRGALLKTAGMARKGWQRSGRAGGADLGTLEVWDGHLARHGAQLLAGRLDLVAALAPYLTSAYATVADDSQPAGVGYRTAVPMPAELAAAPANPEALESFLLDEMGQIREREIERGVCLVGPHRDELELTLGELPAKGYASHGESWSFALALRLAAFELLRADGTDPVLVLDDVFAELDSRRRHRLAGVAASAEQVLVTAAVADDVPAELAGTRYDVADGVVSRAG